MTISFSFTLTTFGLKVKKFRSAWSLILLPIALATDVLIHSIFLQVSVFGGYTDERGDAARNSMSLLEALHDQERTLEVGPVKRFQFIIIITLSSVII